MRSRKKSNAHSHQKDNGKQRDSEGKPRISVDQHFINCQDEEGNIKKYQTYIQFVSTNKNIPNPKQNPHNQFKTNSNLTPKSHHSTAPFFTGRKSAMAKFYPSQSPSIMHKTNRNHLLKKPKSQFNKNQGPNKPNLTFMVNGRKQSTAQNSQDIRQRSLHHETSGKQLRKKVNEKSKNKTTIMKELISRSRAKSKQKTAENTRIDEDEEKLCEKLFAGIKFYRDLGKGAHALVRSAVDWKNKRKIAIKIYNKDELNQEQLNGIEKQIQILNNLDHENVISLYEIIESYRTINLVMEYGGGNSLEQYIKSKAEGVLSHKEAKTIFKQVLSAISYLHESNIAHRDIKAENILLNKHLQLKVIDFGFSIICENGNQTYIASFCGTPTYMAPEVVSKISHNPQLSDRWSLGILLYNMLHGKCPFRASNQKDLFTKIREGKFEYSPTIPEEIKDLNNKFLRNNPIERISPEEALEHSWLKT